MMHNFVCFTIHCQNSLSNYTCIHLNTDWRKLMWCYTSLLNIVVLGLMSKYVYILVSYKSQLGLGMPLFLSETKQMNTVLNIYKCLQILYLKYPFLKKEESLNSQRRLKTLDTYFVLSCSPLFPTVPLLQPQKIKIKEF